MALWLKGRASTGPVDQLNTGWRIALVITLVSRIARVLRTRYPDLLPRILQGKVIKDVMVEAYPIVSRVWPVLLVSVRVVACTASSSRTCDICLPAPTFFLQ